LLVFALQIAEEAEAGDGPLPLPTITKIHNNYAILLMELGRPRQAGGLICNPPASRSVIARCLCSGRLVRQRTLHCTRH
jgi:hypothetical protein